MLEYRVSLRFIVNRSRPAYSQLGLLVSPGRSMSRDQHTVADALPCEAIYEKSTPSGVWVAVGSDRSSDWHAAYRGWFTHSGRVLTDHESAEIVADEVAQRAKLEALPA
jgi:hypothetical protein